MTRETGSGLTRQTLDHARSRSVPSERTRPASS